MYKKTVGLSILLLSGCSTLSSDDDFSDAINEVTRKYNYISIEGKNITPIENKGIGANSLRNTSHVVANYPTTDKIAPESYIAVELSYFRSSYEYNSVVFNGIEEKLTAYSPSTESCTEHCTATQYFTFPIDNKEIEKSAKDGLTYDVNTTNNMSKLSFSIPAGYFQAILDERKFNSNMNTTAPLPVAVIDVVSDSKPVEMTKYWFDESTAVEQEAFTEWAFANRKAINSPLVSTSKSLEMLTYWYEKSSVEDRSTILTWLLHHK